MLSQITRLINILVSTGVHLFDNIFVGTGRDLYDNNVVKRTGLDLYVPKQMQ